MVKEYLLCASQELAVKIFKINKNRKYARKLGLAKI